MQHFVVNCLLLILIYFTANTLAVEEFLFCSENVSILKIVCCETSYVFLQNGTLSPKEGVPWCLPPVYDLSLSPAFCELHRVQT